MIICFSCTAETKTLLDGLVATGHYSDHSAVLTAAVTNLSVIHSELKGGTSVVIHSDRASAETKPAATAEPTSATEAVSDLPPVLRRQVAHKPITFAAVEAAPRLSKAAPLNQWFFGQYNRLLPVKITCRALVTMACEGHDGFSLEEVAAEIAQAAALTGHYLRKLDEKRNLGRDDAFAIAFPDVGQFKSIQRFGNQFVGYKNKEGQLLGLPASLKLIGAHPDNSGRIALTEPGWAFGAMVNPLLDNVSAPSTMKFSEEEIGFLIDHILAAVPVEAAAYYTVLKQIAKSVVTPDSLDEALAALPGQPKDLGAAFVSTQRSGVICRMADLNLIARSRNATRVSYVLLDRGTAFLQTMESA